MILEDEASKYAHEITANNKVEKDHIYDCFKMVRQAFLDGAAHATREKHQSTDSTVSETSRADRSPCSI